MTERNTGKNSGKTRLSSAERPAFQPLNPARRIDIEECLEGLPAQDYAAYSEDAHAVWREVLARSQRVVTRYADHIHPAYIDGLRALQLPSQVPRTDELNERLRTTGWKT